MNTTDMYKDFIKRNPASDINYKIFRYILSEYNKGILELLLEGGTFNIGNKLGRLCVKKFTRNFSRRTVDWGETNKLKKQGINQLVYYTDDYYYGYNWEKRYCTVKNKSVYKFYPAGGVKGPKKQLIRLLKSNSLNHLNFKS
jgi:hypothetical protein